MARQRWGCHWIRPRNGKPKMRMSLNLSECIRCSISCRDCGHEW
jgi:hypothetical protein